METMKYKDTEFKEMYYFKVAIPVSYKIKQAYELFEDDFGNPYYERDYTHFDNMEEAKSQNHIVNEIKEYLKSKGCIIDEEGIE